MRRFARKVMTILTWWCPYAFGFMTYVTDDKERSLRYHINWWKVL